MGHDRQRGGFGVMAISCNQLARHLSPIAVALMLGAPSYCRRLFFSSCQRLALTAASRRNLSPDFSVILCR